MELQNKEQAKTANKFLGLVCEKRELNNTQVDLFFKDTGQDSVSICKELENEGLIKVIWLNDSIIGNVKRTDKTCNNSNITSKPNNFISKIKKFHKTILWIIGGIIFLLTAIGLILDNLDRLTKYLKEKESKPVQEEFQKQQDNSLKIDSITSKGN